MPCGAIGLANAGASPALQSKLMYRIAFQPIFCCFQLEKPTNPLASVVPSRPLTHGVPPPFFTG